MSEVAPDPILQVAGECDTCSAEQTQGWLKETGWRALAHEPLAGPVSLIVAEPS